MKILLTNDDGIEAKGLRTLTKILRAYGEVTVVAPKKPQSGMSMAVTMGFKPIAVKQIEDGEGLRRWYLDGTPASCIKYGIDNIFFPEKPDIVFSGINHGSNAASATLYSGTMGACREAAVNELVGIGVSLNAFDPDADFSLVEKYLPQILQKLLPALDGKRGVFYNINFPVCSEEELKGIKVCHLGRIHWEREYRDYYSSIKHWGITPTEDDLHYLSKVEEGEHLVVMAGDIKEDEGNIAPADHRELADNYITIVPENIDSTDYNEIERLCDII